MIYDDLQRNHADARGWWTAVRKAGDARGIASKQRHAVAAAEATCVQAPGKGPRSAWSALMTGGCRQGTIYEAILANLQRREILDVLADPFNSPNSL